MPDGQIYATIENGVRNMPAVRAADVPTADRWAIVAYVRALQMSQGVRVKHRAQEKKP